MKRGHLLRAYFRHRYAALFYTMVAVLGAGPLLAALGFDRNWTRLFLELNLFIAVFGFPATQRSATLRIVVAFAVSISPTGRRFVTVCEPIKTEIFP